MCILWDFKNLDPSKTCFFTSTSTQVKLKSRIMFWMALGLAKTNSFGVFAVEDSGLHQLMLVNFEKTIIFVHLKSWEVYLVSSLIKGML